MGETASQPEELDEALLQLVDALEGNSRRNKEAIRRVRKIQSQRAKGRTFGEIVRNEEGPLVVELTRRNLEVLAEAGGRVRRLEAAALHAEGFTMDEIAEIFGVTRQRVSTLLREARKD